MKFSKGSYFTSICMGAVLSSPFISGQINAVLADESFEALEEIIITSRKREERLQDTPIAITAFTSDSLEMQNVAALSDISAFTPNLVFDEGTGNTGGSTNSQIYMRGIGQADFLFTSEPGVGVYVDDVYYPRSIGSVMDLIDIQRIEVLKGPQGTLFGKNSVGGAISIVSKRPDSELGGYLKAKIGEFGRHEVAGSLSVPLIENKLLSKVSVAWKEVDGYVDRTVDNTKLGGGESLSARAQLQWFASNALEVLIVGDYTRKRDDSAANTLLLVDDTEASLLQLWNALVAPFGGAGLFDDSYVSSDPFVSQGTGPNDSDLDIWGLSATATLDLGEVTVKSITAYRDQDAFFGADSDHSPLTFFEQTVTDKQQQFSQEIQVSGEAFDGKLRWLMGGMYFHEKGSDQYGILFAPGLYDVLEVLPLGAVGGLFGGAGNPANVLLDYNALVDTAIRNNSYSGFVHGTYKFTDKFSLTAGARFTQDEKRFESVLDRLSAGVTTVDADVSESWNAFTPKIGLEYLWSPDVMTYVSVAKGFKSGGFNGRPTDQFTAEQPFAPEYVWTYEAGVKSSLLDRRLVLNAAAFYSDYTDLQLLSVTSDPNGGIVALMENAGKAKIKGFELETIALLTETLKVNAGIGYLDAEYTELDAGVTAVTLDSELVKTPEWSVNLGAELDIPLADGVITSRVDYSYQTRVEHVSNNHPLLSQEGYGLLGARIVYTPASEKWSVAAYGRNLTDELYITNGLSQLDSLGTIDASFGRPRELGLEFNLFF